MTRDEAKQRCAILLGAMDKGMNPNDRATLLIDGFVSLGMLKLDEPKSIENKALGALVNRCRMRDSHGGDCVSFSKSEADRVIELLNIAGLKIVEK